jgi:light-harvesting protein B-800-850 alpha chain
MNEGRIFLYVSPNVILPIMFLILVLTSLTVHFAILNNTTWFGDFFQGSAGEVAAAPAAADAMAAALMEEAAPAADAAEAAPAR